MQMHLYGDNLPRAINYPLPDELALNDLHALA